MFLDSPKCLLDSISYSSQFITTSVRTDYFCRWLDKLSIAALTNHSRVFRQSFVSGAYALLDHDQNPSPVSMYSATTFGMHSALTSLFLLLHAQQDYWLSVLYKRLVGTRVLYVMDSLQEGRYVRAYAHCAKPP